MKRSNKIKRTPSLKQSAIRRRAIYKKTALFSMIGGPIDSAWLSTPGTLLFSIGEFKGYYDWQNKWVSA